MAIGVSFRRASWISILGCRRLFYQYAIAPESSNGSMLLITDSNEELLLNGAQSLHTSKSGRDIFEEKTALGKQNWQDW